MVVQARWPRTSCTSAVTVTAGVVLRQNLLSTWIQAQVSTLVFSSFVRDGLSSPARCSMTEFTARYCIHGTADQHGPFMLRSRLFLTISSAMSVPRRLTVPV